MGEGGKGHPEGGSNHGVYSSWDGYIIPWQVYIIPRRQNHGIIHTYIATNGGNGGDIGHVPSSSSELGSFFRAPGPGPRGGVF